MKTYEEALQYLTRHIYRTKDPHDGPRNITRTKHLLALLGNPQNRYPTIHVGGTSGKSSTAYFIAKILKESGYKTGLIISPHLQVATERIQINGRFVSEKELVALITEIKPIVEKIEKEKKWGKVGYFQILLAAAFLYFTRKDVDTAVVEVGIGGHYDATNVIKPVLAVITNVGLDHTNVLGETIEEIALDKREIIKKGVPVLTGVRQSRVVALIKEKAKKVGAPFLLVNTNGQRTYQEANVVLAQVASEELKKLGFAKITNDSIRHTFTTERLPGRLEIVAKNPMIILDGAHNPDKISALAKTLQVLFPNEKFYVILADTHRQHHPKMIKSLSSLAKRIILAKTKDGVKTFLNLLKQSTPQDMILVTGSFFLVGKIRNLYYPDKEILREKRYYPKVTSIPS